MKALQKNGNWGQALSPLEERFCGILFATGDCFRAYREAGYPEMSTYKALQVKVWRLRSKPKITQRLREMAVASLEDLRERRGMLVKKLQDIIDTDITDFVDENGDMRPIGAEGQNTQVIRRICKSPQGRTTIELLDKLKAIELLSRISGLLVDKVDITSQGRPVGQAPVNIVFEVVQPPLAAEMEIVNANNDVAPGGTDTGAQLPGTP